MPEVLLTVTPFTSTRKPPPKTLAAFDPTPVLVQPYEIGIQLTYTLKAHKLSTSTRPTKITAYVVPADKVVNVTDIPSIKAIPVNGITNIGPADPLLGDDQPALGYRVSVNTESLFAGEATSVDLKAVILVTYPDP